MRLIDAMERNPSEDNNPLDKASFYVEELKYGPGSGKLEIAPGDEIVGQLESLLREAGITSMTGQQLLEASVYYGKSLAEAFGGDFRVFWSVWLDGLMHGIAFGAGIEGSHRNPRKR